MKETDEIIQALLKFRNEREWEQFHNSKDLALAINVEAGELLELFLWKNASEVKEEKIKELKLSIEHGVVVESLEENSSAKFAGIQPNDVITGINGKAINNYDELLKVVGLTKVGETLNISIIRDGETKTIPVRIRKGI